MLCGVCRGISLHLGVSVWLVRLVFIVTSFIFGAGIIAYIFLWLTVPVGDPVLEAQRRRPVAQAPLSKGNVPYPAYPPYLAYPAYPAYPAAPAAAPAPIPDTRRAGNTTGSKAAQPLPAGGMTASADDAASATPGVPATTSQAVPTFAGSTQAARQSAAAPDTAETSESLLDAIRRAPKPAIIALAGIIMLILSAIMLHTGETTMILPAMMTVSGVLVAWLRFNEQDNQWPTTILGLALLIAAFCITVLLQPETQQMHSKTMLAGIVMLASAALAVIPWFTSLTRSLGTERALKEREEERADMTAHLHDGVLQTLALIQLHSTEPHTVFTLARQQERELRNWLYQERTPPDKSISTGIKDIAAEVEDTSGKPIDVVTVGDAQPSAQTDALLQAAKQALVNAVTHGGEPISVYCEAKTSAVDLYVRDHGDGFDMNAIPEGRLGIRESIVGRIKRRGGSVDIVSRPHWGTEVRMHMPIGNATTPAGTRTHIMDNADNSQHETSETEER